MNQSEHLAEVEIIGKAFMDNTILAEAGTYVSPSDFQDKRL